jgi:hypothetical protein
MNAPVASVALPDAIGVAALDRLLPMHVLLSAERKHAPRRPDAEKMAGQGPLPVCRRTVSSRSVAPAVSTGSTTCAPVRGNG